MPLRCISHGGVGDRPLSTAGQADANQPATHGGTTRGRGKRQHRSRLPSQSVGTSPCPALLLSKYNSQPTRRITAGSAACGSTALRHSSGRSPPPIPAATYFPAMTPAPARRRRRPRSPVLCLRPGPVWRPGTRTQGTRTQVRARGVARERAHPGPTCNPRARPGGSVPPPPAQRPPPRARRAPAGGYITPPLSSSSFSSRRRGAGTGPRPRAQGGAEAAGPAAPGRPHAAPGGHGAAPRGEWEAAAAARSPSAASQTSIPGRRRLRLPRRGFTSRLPPAQGARNRLLPASLSLAALSPLSLPSFLPPPPPLGVPGSGPSSPRPSCERVTRESRATNRRSVNKRRAPGGPARPHPAQPADEAPPAGRHPALRHRRERRGSAGSRARDGGAGRAAPAPLRLPPPPSARTGCGSRGVVAPPRGALRRGREGSPRCSPALWRSGRGVGWVGPARQRSAKPASAGAGGDRGAGVLLLRPGGRNHSVA